jgi:hypothetical protein
LIAAGATAIPTAAVVTYVPHGTMLPISLTWAVIGCLLMVAGDWRPEERWSGYHLTSAV